MIGVFRTHTAIFRVETQNSTASTTNIDYIYIAEWHEESNSVDTAMKN